MLDLNDIVSNSTKYRASKFNKILFIITLSLSSSLLVASEPKINYTSWANLSEKFKCKLSTKLINSKLIPSLELKAKSKHPTMFFRGPTLNPPLTFNIELQYHGAKPVKLKWDKHFGRLLWDREFILTIEQEGHDINSRKLLTATSNIYLAREFKLIYTRDKLKATLDLGRFPAKNLSFGIRKGSAKFQLYLNKKSELDNPANDKKLIPICNSVNILIK